MGNGANHEQISKLSFSAGQWEPQSLTPKGQPLNKSRLIPMVVVILKIREEIMKLYTNRRTIGFALVMTSLFLWNVPLGEAQIFSTTPTVVEYQIMNSRIEGVMVRGTMTVAVHNRTNGEIDNVNLRLAVEGMNHIEKGVYQLGRIPSWGIGVITGEFLFDKEFFDSGRTINWWVEFDDPAMNNFQGLVEGQKL